MRRPILFLAVVALLAAACGGGDGDDGVASLTTSEAPTETTTTAPFDQEQALIDFSQCMRDQGVDFPDPVVDANGYPRFEFEDPEAVDRDALFEAGEECRHHIEQVVLSLPDFDSAEFSDTFLEYAACMRDQGFEDIPDNLDFSAVMRGEELPFDPTDPAFISADEQCRDIFAEFRAGMGRGD
ncbi:MAG: hypothetical protein ABFS21_02310 [Actinomycetota bacterium]